MADFAATPAIVRCRKLMQVVDLLGATAGSVDASRPEGILVQFPSHGIGEPSAIADSACRAFRDAGFEPVHMNVNDRTARFTVRAIAA